MFPLSTVCFPHAGLPLHVFEPRYRALVDDVMAGNREFGTVLIAAGSEVGGGDRRNDIGTLLKMEMTVPFDDGRWLIATRGIERIRVVEWIEDDPYPQAMVEPFPTETFTGPLELIGRASATVRRVRMLLSELDDGPCMPIDIDLGEEPTAATWMACATAPLGLRDAQDLLECSNPTQRLEMLIERSLARIADLEMMMHHPDPA